LLLIGSLVKYITFNEEKSNAINNFLSKLRNIL
jgi:hypothetical protein